jgi:hypothetical protein
MEQEDLLTTQLYKLVSLAGSICTADFNRDLHADLATFNYGPGTMTIFLGDGTGNFYRWRCHQYRIVS